MPKIRIQQQTTDQNDEKPHKLRKIWTKSQDFITFSSKNQYSKLFLYGTRVIA